MKGLQRSTVLVDEAMLVEAQGFVDGCERCEPEAVSIRLTFDYILDAISACDPVVTDYVSCRPAICPRCSSPIHGNAFVIAR